jgi:tetratricopeptide (TPR) repeat protein/O-antigen ligase
VDGVLEAGVIALLLWAPLPHGSVQPWAQAVIEGVVALLVVLWAGRSLADGEIWVRRVPWLWPALAMAALVAWQLMAPAGSVYPYATWQSARLYGAYLGFLFVVSGLALTRARVARLVAIPVAWAVLLAGAGFARQLGVRVPGLAPVRPELADRLTSTFVNPNHQALYFSLALFLALGLLLRPSGRRREGARGHRRGWRPGPLGTPPARALLLGGILVLSLALVLTLSRGGIAGAVAGLLAMLALALSDRVGRRTALPVLLAVAGALAYAAWVGIEAVVSRFEAVMREPVADLRWRVWEAALRIVGEAPLLGIGLGAFEDGFLPHRPVEVPGDLVVDYAHNDFVQLLAETGMVGLLVGLWALAVLLGGSLLRWRARRDPFVRGLVLGGVGAVVAVLVHSAVDFGLHLPANALLAALVVGLLPLVVALHHDGVEERIGLPTWRWRLTPRARAIGVAVTGLCAGAAVVLVVPPGVAGWHLARASAAAREIREHRGAPTQADLARMRADLQRAIAWDPRNAEGWAELAAVTAQLAGRVWSFGVLPSGERLAAPTLEARFRAAQPLFAEAHAAYRESLRLRPRASHVHEQFGWFMAGLEGVRLTLRREGASAPVDPGLADALRLDRSLAPEALARLRESVRWDPGNAYRHRSLGLLALRLAEREGDRAVAATAIARAVALRPELLAGVLDELLRPPVDEAFLLAAMPRSFEVMLDLGRELERRGVRRAAETAFQTAVELAGSPAREAEARIEHARALLRRGDATAALEQARRALILGPREPEAFAMLASVYLQTQRAEEATAALSTAVSLAASGPIDRYNRLRAELAGLLAGQGQRDRAIELWREILRDRPNDAWAHLALGRLLAQRGEAADALRAFRMAASLDDKDWSLQWSAARALRDEGHLREALTRYETARRLHPAAVDLASELGDLYARIGLTEQAREQYRDVLTRQPDHVAARRGLASLGAGAGS